MRLQQFNFYAEEWSLLFNQKAANKNPQSLITQKLGIILEFILKWVVEQTVLIFSIIEAKNLSVAVATVQFFNEK